MVPPNQVMMKLLEKVIMFNCDACKRYWTLRELNDHKEKGLCV
jgi:hypothetical protein